MVSLIKREYDYALRITAYLAGLYPDGTRTILELSRILDISRSLTTRVTYLLIKGGILKSRQGRLGGISMLTDPETTTVLDVFLAMDYDSKVNACLADEQICPLVGFCPIRRKFSVLEDVIMKQFRSIRIKDILLKESRLKTIVRKHS